MLKRISKYFTKKREKVSSPEKATEDKKLPFEKIDVKGGKLTFDQRIALGKIFQEQGREFEMFRETFRCLHNYTPKATDIKTLLPYYYEIIEGLTHWLQAESTMLRNEPTSEELSAGIRELSEKTGEFGTIKSLAKNYGKDPDDILAWEYGKVFGILYTDLEEYKYQKRYNKVLERKYRR